MEDTYFDEKLAQLKQEKQMRRSLMMYSLMPRILRELTEAKMGKGIIVKIPQTKVYKIQFGVQSQLIQQVEAVKKEFK